MKHSAYILIKNTWQFHLEIKVERAVYLQFISVVDFCMQVVAERETVLLFWNLMAVGFRSFHSEYYGEF